MISWSTLENELREALAHLHDSSFQPSQMLCDLAGCDPGAGIFSLRTGIIQVIKELEPEPGAPASAQSRRVYDVLYNRFVLKLTQEETAERLHMSRSSVNRLQRDAIHTLASVLWDRWQSPPQAGEVERAEDESACDIQISEWHAQVKRELESLQAQQTSDTVCDVGAAIGNALQIVRPLASDYGVRVKVKSVQPDLAAAVHPVLLRQMLISCLGRLARRVSSDWIDVYGRLEDGNAKITLTGTIAGEPGSGEADFLGDVPVPEDVSVDVCLDGDQAFVWITAPSLGKVTVLVVDDNEDMARFYRGAAVGTRYHIVHVSEGRHLFETVQTARPDIIVLDVMLPDVDGWTLLMHLREQTATRSLPIIICSVVREQQLARSLGASHYLAKPVRPREFIHALDQALMRDSGSKNIRPL